MIIRNKICMFSNFIIIFFSPNKKHKITLCDDFPTTIGENSIYIIGERNKWNYLSMKCPCGCGDDIEISLNPENRPNWSIKWNIDGTISISPSINRTKKCRSHFFYKKGKVFWCKN